MAKVTVIGLGLMGGALARALCNGGHEVTVWNRSPDKMRPFEVLGARAASRLTDAVAAGPFIVVCIDNYDSARHLLGADDVASVLRGRCVVQLSTGTPAEARAAGAWMAERGADYLDGAIMSYPGSVGSAGCRLLFAGPEDTFRRCKPFLDCFGGDVRHLGSNIAAAATLDMALLTHELMESVAFMHGALLCRSEGVAVDVLAAMFPPDGGAGEALARICTDRYDDPGATLAVWNEALKRIQRHTRLAGINSEVPDFVACLFDRAIAAGCGEQDLAAVFKVLTGEARS